VFTREDCHNHIFLGGSGSGKTELSVNMAIRLARRSEHRICFFDMDQTKGLFRARDLEPKLSAEGVKFCDTVDFMDAPVTPSGISGSLNDPETICVFDVGGNIAGAKMIGQYEREFSERGAHAYYIINPFRPFADSEEEVKKSMSAITSAGRVSIEQMSIISNPCMGEKTSAGLILQAHERLTEQMKRIGLKVSALTAERVVSKEIEAKAKCPVIPVELYVNQLYRG
jgi:hypothetical protein